MEREGSGGGGSAGLLQQILSLKLVPRVGNGTLCPNSTSLCSFPEMWYGVFLWALMSSVFFHVPAGLLALFTLRHHKYGRFMSVSILLMGIVGPITAGILTSGEYSEDDVNELVKEDEVDGEEQAEKTKGKRRKPQSIPARKRKQSGLLLDEEEDGKEDSGGSSSGEGDGEEQEGGLGSENARKKKEDELWASFLNDVGPKSKTAPGSQAKVAEETEETSSNKPLAKADELEKPKESEKVKITKVFDFAGEEVRVTKEVDAASKEAKSFLKQTEKEKPQALVTSAATPLPAGSGIKRTSGMSSLLGKIGAKKQKMSTLEKSKLDWESFKEEEGIGEELAIHNRGKEGYIERKAFLDRVDHRQFEIERDLRLSKMKP